MPPCMYGGPDVSTEIVDKHHEWRTERRKVGQRHYIMEKIEFSPNHD